VVGFKAINDINFDLMSLSFLELFFSALGWLSFVH
jgi:hypothetical protein